MGLRNICSNQRLKQPNFFSVHWASIPIQRFYFQQTRKSNSTTISILIGRSHEALILMFVPIYVQPQEPKVNRILLTRTKVLGLKRLLWEWEHSGSIFKRAIRLFNDLVLSAKLPSLGHKYAIGDLCLFYKWLHCSYTKNMFKLFIRFQTWQAQNLAVPSFLYTQNL